MTLRPSVKTDYPPIGTFRGITAVSNGDVVGVAGVFHGPELQAFSTLNFDPNTHKRFIVKAIREYRNILKTYTLPIYAKASEGLNTADSFLKHVGFEEIGGGVYQWNPTL